MLVSSAGVTARPRAGPGSAPGRRHDRPRGASPQAVSRGWRRLLPDRANAGPRRSPPVLLPAAAPRHGPDVGQAPSLAPPLELQDVVDGAENAPEREARLGLGRQRVQPPPRPPAPGVCTRPSASPALLLCSVHTVTSWPVFTDHTSSSASGPRTSPSTI